MIVSFKNEDMNYIDFDSCVLPPDNLVLVGIMPIGKHEIAEIWMKKIKEDFDEVKPHVE